MNCIPAQKIVLVIGSLCCGILISISVIEVFSRIKYPYRTFSSAKRKTYMSEEGYVAKFKNIFMLDREFGFRPVLGNAYYNIYGTKVNAYGIEKKPGKTRILFIGDSVTDAGYIVDGLRGLYGEEKYEYWNAGVGSFNTVQEVNYYERYNSAIKPDTVILTFVYNDFETTPVAFFDSRNQLVVYSPNISIQHIDPLLFKYSYTYRMFLGYVFKKKNNDRKQLVREVKTSLSVLQDQLTQSGIEFKVVISPYLKPYSEWTEYEKDQQSDIVSILRDLNIQYIDLADVLEKAIDKKIHLQDMKGDYKHPSRELGEFFAGYLAGKHLLD